MLKKAIAFFLCTFLIQGFSFAEDKSANNKTYYVQGNDTPFRSDTSLNAKVQKLAKGEMVTYKGPDPSNPRAWQQVYYKGQLGVIATVNLGKQPPAKLVARSSGEGVDKYTSSSDRASAAAKGLSEAGKTYLAQKSKPEAAAELFTVELINREVQMSDVVEHAKKYKLADPQGGGL